MKNIFFYIIIIGSFLSSCSIFQNNDCTIEINEFRFNTVIKNPLDTFAIGDTIFYEQIVPNMAEDTSEDEIVDITNAKLELLNIDIYDIDDVHNSVETTHFEFTENSTGTLRTNGLFSHFLLDFVREGENRIATVSFIPTQPGRFLLLSDWHRNHDHDLGNVIIESEDCKVVTKDVNFTMNEGDDEVNNFHLLENHSLDSQFGNYSEELIRESGAFVFVVAE